MKHTWEEWNGYLTTYLQSENQPKFRSTFFQCHPVQQAAFFNTLKEEERRSFYRIISPEEINRLFVALSQMEQKLLIDELGDGSATQLLESLTHHDLIRFLKGLPKRDCEQYLDVMKKTTVRKIKTILSYEEQQVGAWMTMEFLIARPNETVGTVLNRVKKADRNMESIYHIYVTEDYHQLVGVVSLRGLLQAPLEEPIGLIMKEQLITVQPHTDHQEMEKLLLEFRLSSIPVVSKHNELLGVVTINHLKERKDIIGSYNSNGQRESRQVALNKHFTFTFVVALGIILPFLLLLTKVTVTQTTLFLLFSLFGAGIAGLYSSKKSMKVMSFFTSKRTGNCNLTPRIVQQEIVKGLLMTVSCSIFAGMIVYSITNGTKLSIAVSIALFLAIFTSTISGMFLAYMIGKKEGSPKRRVESINAIVTSVICFSISIQLLHYI